MYCSLICRGSSNVVKLSSLKKIYVTCNGYLTEPIFKNHNLLKLEDIYKLEVLNLYFNPKTTFFQSVISVFKSMYEDQSI